MDLLKLSHDDFSPTINWNRGAAGIATFNNSLMNLTISGTDSSGVTKTIESRNRKIFDYYGPAQVKGTVTLDGVTYNLNCTVANVHYGELININR